MNQPEQQRRAYLEALGIDIWVPRDHVEPEEDVAEAVVESDTSDWSGLREAVASCTRCTLHESRTQTVFGVGNPDADWMIIGEAPGAEEDRRGEPFVGRAGKLLDFTPASLIIKVLDGSGRKTVHSYPPFYLQLGHK